MKYRYLSLRISKIRVYACRPRTPSTVSISRSMEAMKARAAQAQASITSATTKRTGPAPSAYAPNRYDPNAPPIQSTSQRMANSPILTNQRDKVFHRPLPPPKRTSSGESHTPVEEQERRGGSSAPSPPPVLSRSSTMSSAVNASGRGEKPYSAYNELDKAEFFELLDEVGPPSRLLYVRILLIHV